MKRTHSHTCTRAHAECRGDVPLMLCKVPLAIRGWWPTGPCIRATTTTRQYADDSISSVGCGSPRHNKENDYDASNGIHKPSVPSGGVQELVSVTWLKK